jgi:hypothetical protein
MTLPWFIENLFEESFATGWDTQLFYMIHEPAEIDYFRVVAFTVNKEDAELIASAPKLKQTNEALIGALTWLLDDLTDAGEAYNPETGEEYDSCKWARETLEKAKAELP